MLLSGALRATTHIDLKQHEPRPIRRRTSLLHPCHVVLIYPSLDVAVPTIIAESDRYNFIVLKAVLTLLANWYLKRPAQELQLWATMSTAMILWTTQEWNVAQVIQAASGR